jgi:2-methylcitrate dehydratase PrpD
MDGNDLVAGFVTGINWERLPGPVQRKLRMALLDILGATLAGTLTPISRITAAYAAETWPGDGATILLHDRRASAIGAALANGYAANGIDIDDCGMYTKGHPGAQIFPTALALAESLGLGGAEMLTAMAVGYEVAHRAARIWHASHEVYQACGSWGSVACAAVAAHLLHLTPDQTRHALGIAEYHAPNLPMMRDIDHPAMVKHGIGWGAMTGITAAQLAARGFTGIPSLFGLDAYQDWVTDIGQHYILVDGVIFKEYAACAWGHTAFDATRQLMARHQITVDDIAHIRIDGFYETVRLGTALPATTEQAQFSVAWPLAVLLLDGEIGPEQILEHRFGDGRVRELASRIELVESEEFSALYQMFVAGEPGGRYLSAVTLTLHDGQTFFSGPVEGGINYPQGWDEGQVERKFRWLAGYVLDQARVERLVDLVWRLEQVPDVSELTRGL